MKSKSSKKWYLSKGVWLGICAVLIGAVEVVQTFVELGDFSAIGILTAVTGIAKVVERVASKGEHLVG